MTLTGEKPSSTWKDRNGDVVQIPDNFDDLSEYISSVLKAAAIVDVNTELNCLGHEDVTLHIRSEADGEIRKVTFGLEVRNWREHTGGKSAYSERDWVEYELESGDAEPLDRMYRMGSFFHKIENKVSDLFSDSRLSSPMFKIETYDESSVLFEGSKNLHRYDDL